MAPCLRFKKIFNTFFLQFSVDKKLISLKELALTGDGTPVYTAAQERKPLLAAVWKKGSVVANTTASIISPTVTLAGIPTVTVFTLDTTYILC